MATPTPTSQQMSISMEENGLLPDSKPKVSVPLAGAEVRASMVIYNLPLLLLSPILFFICIIIIIIMSLITILFSIFVFC
jgi:hypothetical protein